MLRRSYRLGGLGDVLGENLGIAGLRPRHRGPHRRRWTIRPDDLLVLDVERVNLRIEPGEGENPARLFRDGNGPAYLVVHFPPQSLAEVAYFTTQSEYPLPAGDPDKPKAGEEETSEELDDPPIDAVFAGWSRLAFIVRDDQLPIDWTIPAILAAIGDLELRVAPNALPPRDPPRRVHPYLEGLFQPAALAERALFAAAAGAGSPPGMQPATSAILAMATGSRDVRSIVRERRMIRTVGYTLGLSDLSGSATTALVDELLETEIVLPIDLTRPEPRAPGATETALELPYRLILSPNRHGAWFHAATPVESAFTGHTELWHTRLGVRHTDGRLIDGNDTLRTVRAIWTLDQPSPATPPFGEKVFRPDHTNGDPFRTSLDGFDRHNVVHLSSNFRLKEEDPSKRFYEPQALDVELLALSSLGAWLDSRGAWDAEVMPKGLSVEEWRHRATLGRDHYVRVVYAGRLFPLGHRASLVKVTERRFEKEKPGHPAYLRQMMFVVVREPLRTYRSSGLTYEGPDPNRTGERWDLKLPFTAARITTTVSPLLDPPEDSDIGGRHQACFWPYVGREPFRFHVVATDITGQPVEFEIPLIFIDQSETDEFHADSIVPPDDSKADDETVTNDYRTRTWPDSPQLLAEVPIGGQQVAFARRGKPDDTSFAVQLLTFDAEVPKAETYDKMPPRQPRWVPVMRQAKVDVPSLQLIAQTSATAPVVYPAAYLAAEFEDGNAGEVFLAADPDLPRLDVGFGSRADRSGGFLAPDMSLSGLSRVTGPVSGALDSAINGSFDPAAWFGALSGARLFGVLQLSDIIGSAPFSDLDKLPRFIGDTLDDVGRIISDLERLQRLLAADPVPQAAAALTTLEQLTDPDTGSIPGLLTGGDPGAVAGQLATLNGQLAALPAGLEASTLGAGARAVITQAVTSLSEAIAAFDPSLLADYAAGNFLPEAFAGRFEWRPVLEAWPAGTPIFKPLVERGLVVSVEAVGDELTVTAALDRFDIDLTVLVLHFDRLQFRSRAGRKPEIDVAFKDFEFAGPLSFIETLRDLIPMDGFSDPPDVTVTPEGITAGFSTGLPNIAVGVFSLENLSLAAGFSVPFVGPPMSTWFRFCERENPARLTVSLFGGGFFFGIVVDAKGLQVAEGAFEFGAAVSVNFGVASGSVSAMAGLYFKIESSDLTLAGYFRLRGEVEALGIVSVCIELYLEMLYETGSGKCVGTATISVEVEVALFSTTIEITATKKFAGSGTASDPTLAETLDLAPDMTSKDWNTYCAAFAA